MLEGKRVVVRGKLAATDDKSCRSRELLGRWSEGRQMDGESQRGGANGREGRAEGGAGSAACSSVELRSTRQCSEGERRDDCSNAPTASIFPRRHWLHADSTPPARFRFSTLHARCPSPWRREDWFLHPSDLLLLRFLCTAVECLSCDCRVSVERWSSVCTAGAF